MFWMEILLDALHKLNTARQDGSGTCELGRYKGLLSLGVQHVLSLCQDPELQFHLSRLVVFWGNFKKNKNILDILKCKIKSFKIVMQNLIIFEISIKF